MKRNKLFYSILGMVVLTLLACNSILPFGGSAVAIKDLPAYTGATELKEGESNIGNTLAKNMEQDAAIKKAMGNLGGGGKLEQRGLQLPAEATWEQVKSFYDKQLGDSGWKSGLGGLAGGLVDVNAVMGAANQDNDLFQTAIWSKDKQTLTLVMITDPTDKTQKQLIMSLSTQ